MACSSDQRGFPNMQRLPLDQAGIALGLALLCAPALGQPMTDSQPPAQPGVAQQADDGTGGTPPTPAGTPTGPANGRTSPSNGQTPMAPGASGQAVQGGPLGGLVPGGGGGPAAGSGAGGSNAGADAGAAGPTSGPQLPEDYEPPAPKPPIMTEIPDPRSTDDEIQSLKAKVRRVDPAGIRTVLMQGRPSPEHDQGVADWAKLQVDLMASAESRKEINSVAGNISQYVSSAAMQQSNSNREREFRQTLAAALTEELRDVLLNNNLYVRLQAAALLGNLNLLEAPARGDEPPVAYTPAIGALLDAIEDQEEDPASNKALLSVRIAAAAGIRRLALDSPSMDVDLRYRAADVLAKELADPNAHFWYQARLAEAMAALGLELNRRRDPIVVTTLLSVISDENRHCIARAAAAKSLSRTPIVAGQFEAAAAASEILSMGREFALGYNKNPTSMKWRFCFYDMYLAFEPADEEDTAKLPSNCLLQGGTLPPQYQTARQRLQPVIDHVLAQSPNTTNPTPIPNALLQPLNQPLPGATETTATE